MDSEQWTEGRDSRLGTRDSGLKKFIVHRSSLLVPLLLFTVHCSLSTSFAATHVTGTYDLGANPRVMATINGNVEYGLVFAQRNKAVTYNGVEYGPSVVKGYLNANGQLNDGAGNLWLDLIPNDGAVPGDSYYVVTINIQGRVHAEIWVVPDTPTVAVDAVRQAQPPGIMGSPMDLATATGMLALAHGGTNQSGWTAARCVRVNNLGNALESAPGDCGTGGGSAPIASATVSGTVKTDATESDPVVYLKASSDTLLAGKAGSVHTHSQNDVTNLATDLAGKVPASRGVSTSGPLAGGGALTADLALSCPTCEVTGSKNAASGYAGLDGATKISGSQIPYGTGANTAAQGNDTRISGAEQTANKNTASGYAGLTSGIKLNAAQGQEVWGATDLTDYSGTSGSGATALKATITSPASNDCLIWNGSNWVNSACPGGGGGDNISVNGAAATDADFDDATPAAPANALNVKWQKDASAPNNLSAYVPYASPLAVTSGNLTVSANSITAAHVAASLDTREILVRIGSDTGSALVDGDDEATAFRNSIAPMTITEVWCESDAGTPSINLVRDGAGGGYVLSSNLSCSTTGQTGTIDTNQDNLATGDKIDFVMASAGGVAKRVTVAIKATVD
ncbi:MAG: hypothetical protein ACE145_07745 [Terriglobia bacterium]